jgi:hypothetical protein
VHAAAVSGTLRPLSQLPGLTQWVGLKRRVSTQAVAQPGGSAGNSDEQDKQQQAASNKSSSSQSSHDNAALEFPLLLASSLSHVNRQYIKMRRRRKWWNKLGGYPKVRCTCTCHSARALPSSTGVYCLQYVHAVMAMIEQILDV